MAFGIRWWLTALISFSVLKSQPSTLPPDIFSDSAAKLRLQETILFSPWDLVMAVSWSPRENLLAVAAGDHIYLYNTQNWEKIATVHVGALTHGLEFSADGIWLAAGSRDGRLRIWQTDTLIRSSNSPPVIQTLAHRKGVNSVRYSPVEQILATGGNDAIARFWELVSGEQVGMAIGGSFAIPSVDFSPKGEYLAIINGDVVRMRQIGSERILGTFHADTPLFRVRVSPDGLKILATGSDNLIRIWDVEKAYRTGQPIYPEPFLLDGHHGEADTYQALVWDAVFDPGSRRLVSVGGDGMLILWDLNSGNLLDSQPAHWLGATCVAFEPGGMRIASGGLDGSLKIWELIP